MKLRTSKQDKGVIGLTILLSIITMLFVIGLLVMIFALMGGELQNTSTVLAQRTATVEDTALTVTDGGTTLTTCAGRTGGTSTGIVTAYNVSNAILLTSGNYTVSGCVISASATSNYNNTIWNVTYTMTYAGASYDVINDTTSSIADVTDWYPIFIVISAMVVLILLVVIIISSIRGSGLMGNESRQGGNVGSA